MTISCVYLIHNTWSEANYKVGMSQSPSRRIGQIGETYEVEPVLIAATWFTDAKTAQRAETYWHRYFQDFLTDDHSGKEWFALTPAQVEMFCKWCELSRSCVDLANWLFKTGATPKERGDYDHGLIRHIPRHKDPPSIDVWMNNDFRDSLPLKISTKVLGTERQLVVT